MNKTVVIKCDDQGQYTVGVEASEPAIIEGSGTRVEEPSPSAQPKIPRPIGGGDPTDPIVPDETNMAPAKDLEDALQQARQLFAEEGDVVTSDGSPNPFQKGFSKVRPTSPSGNLMGPGY